MTDTERLDYVIGQVAALKTFCITIVATHPDPKSLTSCLSALSEVTVAKTLGTAASEQTLAGVESVLSDLKWATTKRDQTKNS